MPLNDEAVKEFIAAYEATDKRRIQLAFNTGIKRSLEVYNKYCQQWRIENDGALPDDISAFPTAACREEIEKLKNTYSDAAPEVETPSEKGNDPR